MRGDVTFSSDGRRLAGQFHRFRPDEEFARLGRVLVWDTAQATVPGGPDWGRFGGNSRNSGVSRLRGTVRFTANSISTGVPMPREPSLQRWSSAGASASSRFVPAGPSGSARRMAAQASDAERRKVADVVLDNSGSEADLEAQIDPLWARLTAQS